MSEEEKAFIVAAIDIKVKKDAEDIKNIKR
jgi:hypothetical protein|nr:MAG TPA: hypothetical protein [Caudoviricetes sp.]DAX55325.1 MAG TPA: hypothetical protein [Caudoviricetes sp.]